jgi:hypothetical protein
MDSVLFRKSPLARLGPFSKLALGSALAAVGGTIIILSFLLGWNESPRPWSFLIGFCGGLSGGAGASLAACGLVRLARRAG